MLIHRISHGAHIVEMDRVSMALQAVRAHGVQGLTAMDLKLPDNTGAKGVAMLKKYFPDAHLIVLSGAPAAECEVPCSKASADVYIRKSAGATEISSVLRLFLQEDLVPLAEDTPTSAPADKLSRRLKHLLVMMDKGLSNCNIAQPLEISEHTVKVHLWRLFKRLSVKSRSQASHLAHTRNAVGPGFNCRSAMEKSLVTPRVTRLF